MRDDIPLTSLMVDPENPRLEVQSGSREAVRELFKMHEKKMLRLAEDISDRGCLSPLEKIGVSESSEHKGRFVVREGNRRVAALMALNNPDLVKGILTGKGPEKLRAISVAYLAKKPADTLECEVLSSDELQQWITLRHTGENEGAGLVPWGPIEQGRYLERSSGRKAVELQFIDRYVQHTQGDTAAADRVRHVPTSTLRRLLSSTPVRKKLGITIDDKGWAYSDYPPDEIHKWLGRVILDLAEGRTNVRDLNTTKQMTDYIDSFSAHELPNPTKALKAAIPVEPIGPIGMAQPSPSKRGKRKAKSWAIKELKIRPVLSRLKDIIEELEAISIERAPNIHAVMLRVFVELATVDYLTSQKLTVPPDKGKDATLKARINHAARHLGSLGKLSNADVTATNKMTANPRFYSTHTLQQFVHNPSFHPSPSDLAPMWKNFGPFLAAMQDR
jgi:hypothetical protein